MACFLNGDTNFTRESSNVNFQKGHLSSQGVVVPQLPSIPNSWVLSQLTQWAHCTSMIMVCSI